MISYAHCVTTLTDDSSLQDRLYRAYASQHAGRGDATSAALIYARDIRPLLPSPAAGKVIDIGCGQGDLVRLLLADGYDACGIDVSPEQVRLAHASGLSRVHQGDYREALAERQYGCAAVTATDFLEHLARDEVLDTFDRVAQALSPQGSSSPGSPTL